MKNIVFYLLLLSGFFLSACVSTEVADSGDVNQDEIYQQYYVEYNAEENESFGTAIFRFGGFKGTTLELSDGSEIELNGNQTCGEKEFLQGMVYRFNNLSAGDTKYTFMFTNTEKNQYTNTLEINSLIPLPPSEKVKNMTETIITWEGTPVGTKESVQVTIEDSKGGIYTESTDLKGANSIIISPDSLSSGLANLQLIRYVEKNLDESTNAGGSFEGAYYSVVIPITISD